MKRSLFGLSSVIFTLSLIILTACQDVSYVYQTIEPVTLTETRVQFNTTTHTIASSTTNVTTTATVVAPKTVTTLATQTVTTTIQAKTLVSGVLSENTIWNSANSPYVLTGAIQVPAGITLTVEAGVAVELRDKFIQVDGTLKVLGSPAQPVIMTMQTAYAKIIFSATSLGWNEISQTGSIIQNSVIRAEHPPGADIGMIEINSSSPKISGCSLTSSNKCIRVSAGSPQIYSNTINGYCGIDISAGSSSILGNTFLGDGSGNGNVGISIWGSTSGSVRIEHNLFTKFLRNGRSNRSYGLKYSSSSIHVDLLSNTIADNDIGLLISGSVLSKNLNAIGNAIFGNTIDAYSEIANDINMANNWWGTTNTAEIEAKLYHKPQDFRLGTITYSPFLTAMPTDVPVLSP